MKKLFFTHTIALFRVVFILLALGYSSTAVAQLKFTASDMVRMAPNSTKWRYDKVECTGNVKVTSITVSMINNNVDSLTSSLKPTSRFYSLGKDPRTNTYLFDPGLRPDQVVTFVKGIVFDQTIDVKDKAQYIHLYVDANPSSLPSGAKITAWPDHRDKSVHYYLWVSAQGINYNTAYNAAKSYYFQGMRGYLATITSEEEHNLLINISNVGGWSAGARSYGHKMDARVANNIMPNMAHDVSKNFRWQCGPESGFEYYRGPTSVSPGVGALNKAYTPWATNSPINEPNNGEAYNDNVISEWCMQINFQYVGSRGWNDLPANPAHHVKGYFIEFGGNGKAYTVGGAQYAPNPLYYTPTEPGKTITNDQWHGYTVGSTAFSEATVKQRTMRSRVMVIE